MLTAVRASISTPVLSLQLTEQDIFKEDILFNDLISIFIFSIFILWHKGINSLVFFAANIPEIIATLSISPFFVFKDFIFLKVDFENWIVPSAIAFLVVTFFIAQHGITYRKEDGERDFVRLLFGCIAATYFFLVLFKDVLGLISF